MLIFLASYFPADQTSAVSSQLPAYAREGAYVYYSALGASVAFENGVNGTLVYKVTNVFTSNGSMRIQVLANTSEGTEAPVNYQVLNYTDNIQNPTTFPAVPVAALDSNSPLVFENVKCSFQKYVSLGGLPDPGLFNTSYYKGTDTNGTVYSFYFERTTGIAVEMASNQGVALQLDGSNVVYPYAPSATSSILPYELDFVAAFAFSAVIFGGAYWYYRSKNKKLTLDPNKKED